jgi:SAM-dependent methyltransferase
MNSNEHEVGWFDRRVSGYDRAIMPSFFGPTQRNALAMVAGVEPAQEMLHEAREKNLPAAFEHAAAEDLPFGDGVFDVVVSTMSFHHWADPRRGLSEAARVLAPGGVVVVAEHFGQSWLRPVFRLLPRRNRTEGQREVEGMLAGAGLEGRA